jgi:hypothetical protein
MNKIKEVKTMASVSVKSDELFELVRSLKSVGGDVNPIIKKMVELGKKEIRETAGEDLKIGLAENKKEIAKKMAELQARLSVIDSISTKK